MAQQTNPQEEPRTVEQRLMAVQNELKAPKNQYNKFGNYRYRSCEDILSAAKPLCVANGLLLTLTDEVVIVSHRIYIKAIAKVSDGTQFIETVAYAREDETKKGMDGSQVTGAASSYARKYALNGLFCIDDTKDADATNTHGKDVPAQQTNQAAERKAMLLQDINGAQSRETLTATWQQNQDLQHEAWFSQAVANAAKKFPKA